VFIKQFTFSHPALIQAAIAAHRAGRDVRIMLNPHRSSGRLPSSRPPASTCSGATRPSPSRMRSRW
jgi:hypothetical protein